MGSLGHEAREAMDEARKARHSGVKARSWAIRKLQSMLGYD
jgi:hypothetical protein